MQREIAIFLVVCMVGCNDEYSASDLANESGAKSHQHSLAGVSEPQYSGGNAAYHSYTGRGISPIHAGGPHLKWIHTSTNDLPGYSWGNLRQPTYGVPDLSSLNDHSSRINARRMELHRLLHELDREQRTFNAELARVSSQFEQSRRAIAMEYDSLNSIMRSVVPMHFNNPEGVYVNAYPRVPWISTSPFVQSGIIQPFPLVSQPRTPMVVGIPATPVPLSDSRVTSEIPPTPLVVDTTIHPIPVTTPDQGLFISSLLQFIETCLSLVRLSGPGSTLEMDLDRIRSSVLSLRGAAGVDASSRLESLSREVNALLPKINALPRKTISEVWIDPLRVSSRDERNKLDRLVQQEARVIVAVSHTATRDEEVNIESSIPNMFTIAGNARTSHHHLKILWDVKSRLLKIVAVCHKREFHKHSDKPRWFFAFTCDDQGGSMRALADPGRNHLTQAVLKVVCHSKEFARRLVLESVHREDRCRISRWPTIAKGLSEPKFSRFDRQGRDIWRSLMERRGCFDADESRIHSRCNSNP